MAAKIYVWDETTTEVVEHETQLNDVDIANGALTPRQIAILVEDEIAQKTDERSTYRKTVREVYPRGGAGGLTVIVLDALFGHDKRFHLYICPSWNSHLAKDLAEDELQAYIYARSQR
jgi:hypothetical protein